MESKQVRKNNAAATFLLILTKPIVFSLLWVKLEAIVCEKLYNILQILQRALSKIVSAHWYHEQICLLFHFLILDVC